MYIDNSIITLIGIYHLKNADCLATYKHLQQLLPLQKSHISQSLAINEKRKHIQKLEGKKYFSTIQITPSGMHRAEKYINFLKNLTSTSETLSNQKKTEKKKSKDEDIPLKIDVFIKTFSTKFYSTLKDAINNSLLEYIPKSHLTNDLIEDLTDTVMNFFDTYLLPSLKNKK